MTTAVQAVEAVRRSLILVLVAGLVGAMIGGAVALVEPRTYTARTQIFVTTAAVASDLAPRRTFLDQRIESYVELAHSRAVLGPVIESLGLPAEPAQLADRVDVTHDRRTLLITIAASDHSPAQAALIADTVAEQLVVVVDDLEHADPGALSPVHLTVAEAAAVPAHPENPSRWLRVLLGLVIGLAVGIGVALLRSLLDNKVRDGSGLRTSSETPVLASIPLDLSSAHALPITDIPVDNPRAEAFRRLRTNLRFAQVDDSAASVLVTSSVAGEGRTTTSINLAIVMAQSGQRVALVDADLRNPSVADQLGLENSAGLTTALLGTVDVSELLQPWGDDELYVLTAGEVPPNPAELLESRAMERLLGSLLAEHDLVVIDGAPLLPVADSLRLAQRVGRVLLVAGVGQVRVGQVTAAMDALRIVEATRVGLVLNKVRDATAASRRTGWRTASPGNRHRRATVMRTSTTPGPKDSPGAPAGVFDLVDLWWNEARGNHEPVQSHSAQSHSAKDLPGQSHLTNRPEPDQPCLQRAEP